MSTLSSVGSGMTMRQSPLQRLQAELSSEVSSGTIASADQDALSKALDSIDSSLKSERSSGGTGSPPNPQEMQSKIDDLIQQQVSSGALTSDQATELKSVFSNAMPKGGHHGHGAGGVGGPGGPGGAGAPPPSAQDSDNDNDSDSTSAASGSSPDTDIQSLLQDFLKTLQDKLNSSSGSYSSNGQSGSFTAALVVDYKS